MGSGWRWVGWAAVVCAVAVGVACGAGDGSAVAWNTGAGSTGGGGGGNDGGAPDAGPADSGPADAGPADAGPPDGGPSDGGGSVSLPSIPGWDFYGPQHGGPQDVRGVTMDEAGNLWVAGGAEGLFLMRVAADGRLTGRFEKFGIADGLHPYGWLNGEAALGMKVPDGTPADMHPSLTATPVISVAGGPPGTVFVGYQGKPGCEDAWHGDQWTQPSQWGDPAVYKSGDADRVTLSGSGIAVVHYDIFSGPGVVADEPKGREKICSVYRLVWDKEQNRIWFGGNHGFAMGRPDFPGNPTCNGLEACAGVSEHVHPAFNDTEGNYVTQEYWGVAVDPLSQQGFHDVWFGGMARTTRFRFGETGGSYSIAQPRTEAWSGKNIKSPTPDNLFVQAAYRNRIDVWPDAVSEYDQAWNPTYPTPAQWKAGLDVVSGIAADPSDNSVYIASFANGIRHLDHDGNFIADLNGALFGKTVSAIAIDPDGSLWVGYKYEGGVSRIRRGGAVEHLANSLGQLEKSPVPDIQIARTGPRRVLVAFQSGAVAIYKGN